MLVFEGNEKSLDKQLRVACLSFSYFNSKALSILLLKIIQCSTFHNERKS